MKLRSITGLIIFTLIFLFQPLMGVFSTSSLEITTTIRDSNINMAPGDETTFNLLFRVRDDLNYQVDISFENHPSILLNTNQSFIMSAGSSRLLSVDIIASNEINIGDYQVRIIVRYYPISDALSPNDYEEAIIQTTINVQPPEKIPNALITISNFEGEALSNSISLFKLEGDNLVYIKDYANGRLEDRLEPGNYFVSSFEQEIEILSHEFTITTNANYRYNHQTMSHYFTELLAISFLDNNQRQIIVDYELTTLLNNSNEIWIEFSIIKDDLIIETPQFQEIGVMREENFEGRYIYNLNQETDVLDTTMVFTAFYFDDLERINVSDPTSTPVRSSTIDEGILSQIDSISIILIVITLLLTSLVSILLVKRIINQKNNKALKS